MSVDLVMAPEQKRPPGEPCCELNFTLDEGERETTCCYAPHDELWVRDPDGTPWEVFATHADVGQRGACCA